MPQQLDIFDDSRDVALRNELADALQCSDLPGAQQALAALQAGFPRDLLLAPGRLLLAHMAWQQGLCTQPAPDLSALLDLRGQLLGPLASAATAVLGAAPAQAWLAGQWRWLARQAAGISWQGEAAQAHPAALYLLAGDWAAAAEAVAAIESWRRIPQPLLWMLQAHWHQEGAETSWPLLAEALWLAPAAAAALLPALAGAPLRKLCKAFEERFDAPAARRAHVAAPEPAASQPELAVWRWLPAFALVENPLLAKPLELAQPPAELPAAQGFQVVQALLRLERQGRHAEIMAQRARLKALSAPLFAAYMATR